MLCFVHIVSFSIHIKIEEKLDKNGNSIKVSKESGHAVEYTSESNYIFKLKDFKKQLKNYIESNVVMPVNYSQVLHSQIDELQDLSISRDSTRIDWGIKVQNFDLNSNNKK